MKRRWPLFLFCLCWLLILLAPPLRRMFWIQASGQSSFYGGVGYGPLPKRQWTDNSASIAARFPNDPRVLAVVAENTEGDNDGPRSSVRNTTRAYDALIKRFPKENWILALRVRHSLGRMLYDRQGGEFSDGNRARAARHQSPERVGQPNYTPQELKEAIAMARLGQQREPDNAFYDYALFCFLMMGWRDREAWPVLSAGSHKPRYDAHHREWLQAHLAVQELEYGRPLLFEELAPIRDSLQFWELGRGREMARIARWEGEKAARRGEHAKALRFYGDMARLQALRARQSYFRIETGVANGIVMQLTGGSQTTIFDLTPAEQKAFTERVNASAKKFALYAAQYGTAAQARELGQLRQQAANTTDRLSAAKLLPLYSGLDEVLIVQALEHWWAATIVLLALVLLLPLFLALSGLLRWACVAPISPARRDLVFVAFGVALVSALCVGLALHYGAGWRTVFLIDARPAGNLDLPEESNWLLDMLLLCGAVAPGWLATLFCIWLAARCVPSNQIQREPLLLRPRRMPRLSDLLNVRWLDAPIWLLTLVQVASPLICLWFIGTSWPFWAELFFVCALLLFPLRWLFFTPAADKPRAAYRLRLLHQSLGALIVAASVCYLLLLVVSVPLRARLDAQMQQLVQRGEVALLLEKRS